MCIEIPFKTQDVFTSILCLSVIVFLVLSRCVPLCLCYFTLLVVTKFFAVLFRRLKVMYLYCFICEGKKDYIASLAAS